MRNKRKFVQSLILIIILLSATSVFAEKTIPGDTFYNIKIMVNEPIAGIFALTDEEKAEWKERIVERRLNEAQNLIALNRLDEPIRLELQDKIKTKILELNTSLIELSQKKKESINSSNLNIRLQASLMAYADVYNKLMLNTDERTRQETEKFIITLSELSDEIKDAHASLELNLGEGQSDLSDTQDALYNSALGKQNIAVNLLNSVKLSYQKSMINLSVNIQNQINYRLSFAETNLKLGMDFMDSKDYIVAQDKFQSVITVVNEAKLLILSNVIKWNIEDDIDVDGDDEDIEDSEVHKGSNDQFEQEEYQDEFENEKEDDLGYGIGVRSDIIL